MNEQQLAAEVEKPELHRALLGGFKGPYSLGVGRNARSANVLILLVPPEVTQSFPAGVDIAGEWVPVLVDRILGQPLAFDFDEPGRGVQATVVK